MKNNTRMNRFEAKRKKCTILYTFKIVLTWIRLLYHFSTSLKYSIN
ncbi:Uncharacterised protein [Niallia circulans]|nr:Uncharacterised protein [Niallia circulans]